MLGDLATDTQIKVAQVISGATMVAFLAARMFRRHTKNVRLAIAGCYIAGVLGFVMYVIFWTAS
jgi:hypothetical protein